MVADLNGSLYFKNKAINKIIEIEGGYVDHPDDGGGKTNWGITEIKAQEFGYYGDMRDLSRELAFQIYEKDFYEKIRISRNSTIL